MKKISISIVTFNSSKVIKECITSLMAAIHNSGHQIEVFVVDNGSEDNTVEIVQNPAFQNLDISLFKNAANVGFGSAHNKVIMQMDSDYHILCNPDIIVNNETIGRLVGYLDKHPDIGIVCPKLLNTDGSLQPNNHRNPNILALALRRLAPAWLKQFFKKRLDAYIMLDVGYANIYDVPFLSGAFMFCRTVALKQVNGFDERYFLYFEDADLCKKIQQAGYRTIYFPDAKVIHGWERAAHKNWRMTWVMLVSAYKYFNKWGYAWY